MNGKLLIYTGIALFVGIVGGYVVSQSKVKSIERAGLTGSFEYAEETGQQQGQLDRESCLANECLLVEGLEYPVGELPDDVQEALDEAIHDEYKALATYEAVVAKFGMVKPFSMIMGAEEQHIASLKVIYDKYGLDVPENPWFGKMSAPASLQEACQAGVEAEIANADLYKNELLPVVQEYADITAVFTNLMNASEQKHLPAFERCD